MDTPTIYELYRYIQEQYPDEEVGENQYRCAQCNEVYDKAWTDEEALDEYEERFEPAPMVIVCDDCYKRIMDN